MRFPSVIFRSSGGLSDILCCPQTQRVHPFHLLRHNYPNHKSLLGHPTTSQPKPKSLHPPMLDNDGFRTVVYKRNRRRLSTAVSQHSIDIEAKTFRSIQKHTVYGTALQISEQWSSLFSTILVPLDALAWLTKTFKEAIEDHSISAPQWLHKGCIKLSVRISSNDRGCFISIMEFLPRWLLLLHMHPKRSEQLQMVPLSALPLSTDAVELSHKRLSMYRIPLSQHKVRAATSTSGQTQQLHSTGSQKQLSTTMVRPSRFSPSCYPVPPS